MTEPKRPGRSIARAPALVERDQNDPLQRGTLAFLTPVFGGGVAIDTLNPQCKHPDSVTPVRGASVRGQLREWWRRTCGFDERGAPLDLRVLRAREALLWGWASTSAEPRRGWVSVAVDASNLGGARPLEVLEPGPRERWRAKTGMAGVAYGTFPLSPKNASSKLPAGKLTEYGGTFEVTLRAGPLGEARKKAARVHWGADDANVESRMRAEVERAWLAWTTFGGVGGRTRRGFGAVKLADARPFSNAVADLGWAERVHVLGAGRIFPNEFAALDAGLARLKDFRQGVGLARNPGQQPNRPGRSRWPEPDQIRRLTRTHAVNHAPIHVIEKFPRAAFGMPIIFHFQDFQRNGEPGETSLQPAGLERLASPLVIRPVVGSDRKIRAIALVLPQRVPLDRTLASTVLKVAGSPHAVAALLSSDEQDQIAPLADQRAEPESGAAAVLHPFLRYFKRP